MCVCVLCACLLRPEEAIVSSGTGIIVACELSCGCWELNLGPLQKWQVLLTVEPSVHQEALKLIRHVGPEGDAHK